MGVVDTFGHYATAKSALAHALAPTYFSFNLLFNT